jgi:hypothetical protein
MAIQIARWEKNGYMYEVEQVEEDGAQRFLAWGGVLYGTKWQRYAAGKQDVYKTLGGAMKVYTRKTQQAEELFRKHGNA